MQNGERDLDGGGEKTSKTIALETEKEMELC